jgi:hypothetical protein
MLVAAPGFYGCFRSVLCVACVGADRRRERTIARTKAKCNRLQKIFQMRRKFVAKLANTSRFSALNVAWVMRLQRFAELRAAHHRRTSHA